MLSFLWCRIFISPKERLRPRNIWNCFGDLCVFGVFLRLLALAACEFFMTLSFVFVFCFFNFFLRRGFGISSNLWYKYRLLVLGSTTYTLKPLNSEDNCFRVIPSTRATLKTRLGLWEQLTKFWKEPICFLWISPFFNVYLHKLPTVVPETVQAPVMFSRGRLFSHARLLQSQSTRQLPSVTDCFCLVCSFLKCEALGPNC